MHDEVKNFILYVQRKHPQFFYRVKVLDVGSRDINGNNRWPFAKSQYTGVDVSEGPNVDVVAKAHEMAFDSDSFDVVISTEMLEHDPFWWASCRRMLDVLKPGGLLIITCATEGRPEHGTRRSDTLADNPAADLLGPDYYRNLTESDLLEALPLQAFSQCDFMTNDHTHDLYFWGIKK